MKKTRYIQLFFVCAIAILSVGCGGGTNSSGQSGNSNNGSGENPAVEEYKNQLVDSPLAGVDYYCDNKGMQKTTNNGEFSCHHTPIVFKIGKLKLGTIYRFTFDGKIFPQDLVGVSRANVTDEKLIEMVRLLQSLDEDGNISISITIPSDMASKFDDEDINDRTLDELADIAGVELVSKEVAIAHLTNSMINIKKDIGQFALDGMKLWMTGCWYKHGETRDSYGVNIVQIQFQERKARLKDNGAYMYPYEFVENESLKLYKPDNTLVISATSLGEEYYQDSLSDTKDIISLWATKEEAELYQSKVGDGIPQHRTCTIGAIDLRPLAQ